jgi:hypothetical protein
MPAQLCLIQHHSAFLLDLCIGVTVAVLTGERRRDMFMLMEKSIVDDNSLIYICHERVSHARKVPEQSPAPCIKLPGALQTVASSSFQALSLSITHTWNRIDSYCKLNGMAHPGERAPSPRRRPRVNASVLLGTQLKVVFLNYQGQIEKLKGLLILLFRVL